MFALPEFEACCCCCSLRTGTKVFGFFSLCRCIFVIILLTLEMTDIAKRHPEEYAEASYFASIEILIRLIYGTASFLLLLSAYQESRRFLPVWIVATMAMIILNVILPSAFRRVVIELMQFWALLSVVTLLIDLYGILVVYSYYRSMTSLVCQAVS